MAHRSRLGQAIQEHLDTLCNRVGNRHVGSPGNRAATDYFNQKAKMFGFVVECEPFDCLEWEAGPVDLQVGGKYWDAFVTPYSLACDANAELVSISTLDELAGADVEGRVLLLHGPIASEPIMPKSFVFYNPEHHKKLVSLLETQQPAAIIGATGKHPGTAGSLYPFPLFEDGDFDIPSVFIKDVVGKQLASHAGEIVRLRFDSRRIPATACNPVASTGHKDGPWILVSAHIDAKKDTPGALDNASGVVVLLALAELLAEYTGRHRIELVAFNGEDYYSVPGQMQYLANLGDQMDEIELVINLDGAGYKDADIAYSFYNCPDELKQTAANVFSRSPGLIEGESWAQGDHSMFTMEGRSAIAITSTNFAWLCQEITHTAKDSSDLVDVEKLAQTARAIYELVLSLSR